MQIVEDNQNFGHKNKKGKQTALHTKVQVQQHRPYDNKSKLGRFGWVAAPAQLVTPVVLLVKNTMINKNVIKYSTIEDLVIQYICLDCNLKSATF